MTKTMGNLPSEANFYDDKYYGAIAQSKIKQHSEMGFDKLSKLDSAKHWRRGSNSAALDKKYGKNRPMLPICPYGCDEEGQLKEIVMGTDGRAMGIFADSDACVFVADIQLGEPPKQKKLQIGPDGEYHEVES